MENLFDTISEDLKSAMKQRQKVRLDALRYVKKLLIENKTSKKPRPEIDVMIAYNKQLSDSLEAYPKDSDH